MPERALLVFDGDCAYCRRWIRRFRRLKRDRVECVAYQDAPELWAEVPPESFRSAVHLRDSAGRWTKGAEAVFGALRGVPVLGVFDASYRHVPGFATLSEAAYRWVARNRHWLPI